MHRATHSHTPPPHTWSGPTPSATSALAAINPAKGSRAGLFAFCQGPLGASSKTPNRTKAGLLAGAIEVFNFASGKWKTE